MDDVFTSGHGPDSGKLNGCQTAQRSAYQSRRAGARGVMRTKILKLPVPAANRHLRKARHGRRSGRCDRGLAKVARNTLSHC